MPSDRVNWNHQADKDLLGVISKRINPSQDVIRELASDMVELGYKPTPKAIMYQLFLRFDCLLCSTSYARC